MKNKSIILLSGGLDSLVSLGVAQNEYNIQLALTFDYGQKSLQQEVSASKEIAKYYNIEHKVIELPFLKEITKTALVSNENVPIENLGTTESAKAVWVPNRNGLFLNIAASYADTYEYTHILFGANKEEGATFPDNTQEFIDGITESFKYSTMVQAKVVAPLINYDKNDIVRLALEQAVPLEMARSCYNNGEKNCGVCESCKRLKSALEHNNANNYIERLF
ncbi:MAG: 7-cyano-7-deazaguanine synthase QueC [Candidatus Gastranaerophilales bacterium]|nr:7-cyano-7-deazaguanine synthase QueC [Candidatus Gastranaerophilales bacterium]